MWVPQKVSNCELSLEVGAAVWVVKTCAIGIQGPSIQYEQLGTSPRVAYGGAEKFTGRGCPLFHQGVFMRRIVIVFVFTATSYLLITIIQIESLGSRNQYFICNLFMS